jgi:site-specific DNA recombinase
VLPALYDDGGYSGGTMDRPALKRLTDVAREEQMSVAYLYTLLRLPWLAPDITTAIINGRKPPQLTAQRLMRLTPRLPANWAEQRKLLGCS